MTSPASGKWSAARRAVLVVTLSLLASALAADTDDPWETDPKTTCWQTAWPLTGLGVVGLVVILVLRGAVISHNEIYTATPGGAYPGQCSVSACWWASFSSGATVAAPSTGDRERSCTISTGRDLPDCVIYWCPRGDSNTRHAV